MASLKSENEILSGILTDKEIYIDNLISRIGELERQVVDQHETAKLMDTQILTLKQDMSELNLANKNQLKVINEFERQVADQCELSKLLEAQILTLQQDKSELNQTNENQSTIISELTQIIRSKENIIQNLIMLVDFLDRCCQDIFESRTWKIGFKLAQIKRFIYNKDVSESSETFISYDYINKNIQNNSAYSFSTSIDHPP